MLTNKENVGFTITELEVWGVEFLVINCRNLIIYRTEEKSQRDHKERDTHTQKERSQQAPFVVVITAIIFKHFTLSHL
jgi:hypothetical protein